MSRQTLSKSTFESFFSKHGLKLSELASVEKATKELLATYNIDVVPDCCCSLIVAKDADTGFIGDDGKLPWAPGAVHGDLKRFKELTRNKPVVMGRKTMESLPGPLPFRTNLVVSRGLRTVPQGFWVHDDLDSAMECASGLAKISGVHEYFVIGGASIYAQAMPYANRLYVTDVQNGQSNGRSVFPDISPEEWDLIEEVTPEDLPGSSLRYTFRTYIRKDAV